MAVEMMHIHHHHDHLLTILSVFIAIFASYTALDLANSVSVAKGRSRIAWMLGGSMAMGVGIWSMHFIAMLAFSLPGVPIAYDVLELILSVVVAIFASFITLFIVSRGNNSTAAYVVGSLTMGAAIAGMHYIGIASMRMSAGIHWNVPLVGLSLVIAVVASFGALWLAFRFRDDLTYRGFWLRGAGGVVMGIAISGMHFTAMAAMHIYPSEHVTLQSDQLLATSGLAVAVIAATLLILGIALTGSIVDRALSKRVAMTKQVTMILESITDAFFSVDRGWRFTYVNKVAQDTLRQLRGAPLEPLLGGEIWREFPRLLGTRFETEFRRAMTTGNPSSFEEVFSPSGLWFEIRAYPSPEGLSVYFRDVSERKLAEQELQRAVKTRDEFLSIASHELKTPITSIKLQAQLMKRGIEKKDPAAFAPERVAKLVEQFDRQTERITRLVEDMLDISRITAGRLTVNNEDTDLCQLTREMAERFRPIFQASGCELTLECVGEVRGQWDHFRLEQVVSNLLTNAVKYAPGQPVAVTVFPEGAFGVLRVRDRGKGISPEDRERIFQKFERAVSRNDSSGLGLGLYIARTIVELHGGRIEVESEEGRGATFTVRLPL